MVYRITERLDVTRESYSGRHKYQDFILFLVLTLFLRVKTLEEKAQLMPLPSVSISCRQFPPLLGLSSYLEMVNIAGQLPVPWKALSSVCFLLPSSFRGIERGGVFSDTHCCCLLQPVHTQDV